MRKTLLLSTVVCLFISNGSTASNVLVVPNDFPTIQEAIEAVDEGGMVTVLPGTYYENIQFNGKNCILTSTDPNDRSIVETTVIDGNRAGHVILFKGTETADCMLRGLTITNGKASVGRNGGGINGMGSFAKIEDCIISSNSSQFGGGIYYHRGDILKCEIINNSSTSSGAGLHDCDGKITDCIIIGNEAHNDGGGLSACGGEITNCIISNNIAGNSGYGGGLYSCSGSVTNCIISNNSAGDNGGGLSYCNATVTNCEINNNSTNDYGGGFFNCNGAITNCTITSNTAVDDGGGLYFCDGPITNCIIWNNHAKVNGNQLLESADPTYSCIQGWINGGQGNITSDPEVVGTSSPNPANWDLRLQPSSPCIDAGDPNYMPLPDASDLDGNPRINNVIVDMGAYEFVHPLQVWLDIKPDSCPNPLNVNSKGVLPVATLGSDVFDVNSIDPNSILLEGISPIRFSLEDITAPNTDPNECACSTEGPDGYIDLTLKFDTQEIVDALGEVVDGETWMLHLTGNLKDGTPIEGTDCIEIKKKGKK